MAKTTNADSFDEQKTSDVEGKVASAKSVIVPFMKTHQKMPHGPNQDTTRTRTYQHPNERFKKLGTWKKI